MDRQKKEYYSEWTTVITKKTKHRIGKGDNGILKAAQKPVVLFISRVDPDTTQEEVEKFANIHFQKTKIHCEKLYGSFKVNLQGVEMEDALSPYVWPSGISVKKLFYGRTLSHKKGWNNQHPTTVNNGSKKWRLSVVTYNCRGLAASLHDIEQLCAMYHIIFLQETWLAKQTLDKLTDISDNRFACGTAEVDYTKGITSGRPHGGTAILWNKKLNAKIFHEPRPKYHWSGGVPRL